MNPAAVVNQSQSGGQPVSLLVPVGSDGDRYFCRGILPYDLVSSATGLLVSGISMTLRSMQFSFQGEFSIR